MKLFHVILLASAGAATVLGAGAVAEKSAVSLGPHLSQAASELLEEHLEEHLGSNAMLHLRVCRDGNYLSGSCYDIVMDTLLAGEDRVRNVTLKCEIKCRRFPGCHCFDTCKRAQLNERYDGEIEHSLHLLRKMLGIRKMTMLERWGLGFLKYVLDWVLGAFCFILLAGSLYRLSKDMAHAGTPETVRSGLLWGSIICSFFGSVFVGMAIHKLLSHTAGDGELAGASFFAVFAGALYYARQRIPDPHPARLFLLIYCLFHSFFASYCIGSASQKLFAYVISVDKSEESATA